MMKVAYREEREPSSWIGAYTMDEHEGGSKLTRILTGDHVHHSGRVLDGAVPECLGHSLFGKVRPGHVYHDFPVSLNKAVGRLVSCRTGGN